MNLIKAKQIIYESLYRNRLLLNKRLYPTNRYKRNTLRSLNRFRKLKRYKGFV